MNVRGFARHTKAAVLGVALATALGGSLMAPPAHAQWVVFDPTNYLQNFTTALRAVQSNINEAQQIAGDIERYRNMLKNTESLTGGDWSGMNNAIGRLDGLLQQGKGLAVSVGNYEQVFRTRFPGYKPGQNYAESYREWNETSMDSVLGALRVANMQVQGVGDERQAIARLRAAASSSGGQKAALDASNQIALSQVEQLQQLRELMVAQMQGQGTFMAAEAQSEAAKAGSIEKAASYKDPREGWTPKPARFKPPSE